MEHQCRSAAGRPDARSEDGDDFRDTDGIGHVQLHGRGDGLDGTDGADGNEVIQPAEYGRGDPGQYNDGYSSPRGRWVRRPSTTLAGSGGTTPYSWSISAGALPGGLTLGAKTGTISGTPTASGTFSFTAEVTDSTAPTAQTATKLLSLTVDSVESTPLATSVPLLVPAVEGAVYNSANGTTNGGAILNITGGTPPYTCSLTSGSLPDGMSISETMVQGGSPAALCVLSGTPTSAGRSPFDRRSCG